MDRRTFLLTSAAAVGAATLSTRAAHTRPVAHHKPEGVRIGLKIGMIREGNTLAEKFAVAAQAGFAGVELDSPNTLDPDEVIAAQRESGLVVPGVVNSVHWQQPLSHPDRAVREQGRLGLEQAIRDSAAYGGKMVLLVPGIVNEQVGYADAYARSQEEIAAVLPVARSLGVQIAIENVWNNFLLSPLEAARYVDELNDAAGGQTRLVGWYFDVGNIWHMAWPRHWLDALGPDRVLRLDIKGFSRAKADQEGRWAGFRVAIDEGDLPWESVAAWIREHRWQGWVTAEVAGGDLAHLTDIARRMRAVLELGV